MAGILIIIPTLSFAGDIVASQFQGGLDTQDSPAELDPSQAQDLLNVNIQPGGAAIFKRDGYGLFQTLSLSTEPIHGGYHFQQTGGSDVQLWGNGTKLSGIVSDATAVIIATGTEAATWQCADSQGFAYCLTSSRDTAVKTDGTVANTSYQAGIPLGTMLTFSPTQLIVAGVSGNESTIYVSQQNAFTTFTIGVLPTSAFTEPIASPGSRITHMAYYFGKLFWWKDQSFGYATFTNQNDWQLTIVSNQVGTLDNSDAFWNSSGFDSGTKFSGAASANAEKSPGGIFFRGQDNHLYVYDGYYLTRLSRVISPTVVAASRRKANAWNQTSQSDFASGAVTFNASAPSVSTAIVSGVIYPSSITVQDTSSSDFGSATVFGTGIDTFTVSGAVTLKTYLSDPFTNFNNWTSETCGVYCTGTTSASGGEAICSTDGGCMAVSTQTVNGDFTIQFKASKFGSVSSLELAALDNSRQGYGISIAGGLGPNLRRHSNFFDKTTGSVSLCNGTSAVAQGDILTLTRIAATNTFNLYRNAVLACTTTDATYTSFTNVRMYLNNGSTSNHMDDVYDTAGKGYFNSRAFDTTFSTPVYGSFVATTASTGTFAYGIRCSSASASNFTAETSITNGGNVTGCGNKRFLIYTSTISAPASASSLPQLADATTFAESTGTYYSAVNSASSLTSWGTLSVSDTEPGSSTITYYTRSSTSSFTVLSATPAWVLQNNNATVAASTGTFFQMRADFGVTAATETPSIADFQFNWFEGTASDKAYITYFNDAIWFAVSASSSVSTNNRIFYWDILNGAWLIYDIASNGFLIENNRLYIGDPLNGKVYLFGSVTTDNSAAINSYWRSKSFLGADPFVQNEFMQSDFVLGQSSTTLTYTYTLDSKTATSYTMTAYDSSASLIQRNFLLPVGKIGKYYDFKVGDNSSAAAWRLMGHRVHYNALNWVPVLR